MRRAFTVLEFLVVIVVLVVLTATLFPVFARTHCSEERPACRSLARQLGNALKLYVEDYDQRCPPAAYTYGSRSVTLPSLLQPYLKMSRGWGCRQAVLRESTDLEYDGRPDDATVSYGYNWLALAPNGIGVDASRIAQPANVVTLVESTSIRATPPPLVAALGGTPPAYRHETVATVWWLDGHVQSMTTAKLEAPGGKTDASGIDAYLNWNLR